MEALTSRGDLNILQTECLKHLGKGCVCLYQRVELITKSSGVCTRVEASFQMAWEPGEPEDNNDGKGWPGSQRRQDGPHETGNLSRAMDLRMKESQQ